jgi:hypothetical protein
MVNFIIRDGDKFVLNGNELMRTENPVLEVPDIVGSEEVTEKIAEDVQVGDFLYNARVDMESFPFTHFKPGAYSIKLAVWKGDLLAFLSRDGFYFTWRYKDGQWEDYGPGNQQVYGTSQTLPIGGQISWQDQYLIKEDKVYAAGGRYGNIYPNPFSVDEWDGRQWLSHYIQDVSAFPNVRPFLNGAGDELYRYAYGTGIYEASGIVHTAVGHEGPYDSSGNPINNTTDYSGISMYTFDTSTGLYSVQSFDASDGNAIYVINYAEIDNNLYCIAGGAAAGIRTPNVNLYIWKWNPSTTHWDFHQFNNNYDIGNVYDIRYRQLSDGHYLIAGGSSNYGVKIYKFNESTGYFDDFLYADAGHTGYITYSVDIFEVGSTKYIVKGHYIAQSMDDEDSWVGEYSGGTYLGKIDMSTSTYTMLESPKIDAVDMRNHDSGNSYVYIEQLDVITHEGKTHLMLSERTEPGVYFYTFDPVNERFDRDYRIYQNFSQYGVNRDLNTVEYNGSSIALFSTHEGDHFRAHIRRGVDASSGWIPTKRADIPVPGDSPCSQIWEDTSTSTLYAAVGAQAGSPRFFLYEYETSANQFLKLAPSGVTLSSNTIQQMRSVDFSGTRFFVMGGFASPYMEVYTFSAGHFYPYTTPSGINTTCYGADIKVFDNKLHLVATHYKTGLGSDQRQFSWRLDSSGWTEIPFDIQYYSRLENREYRHRVIRLVEHESNFYCVAINEYFPGRVKIWKYNPTSSEWNEQGVLLEGRGQPYDLDVISHGGYIWIAPAQSSNQYDGSFNLVRYNPDTKEIKRIRQLEEANSTVLERFLVMNDELYVVYSPYSIPGGPRTLKVSEFLGEYAWRKSEDIKDSFRNANQAYGIALESGSKGDTIKIRKVKR